MRVSHRLPLSACGLQITLLIGFVFCGLAGNVDFEDFRFSFNGGRLRMLSRCEPGFRACLPRHEGRLDSEEGEDAAQQQGRMDLVTQSLSFQLSVDDTLAVYP